MKAFDRKKLFAPAEPLTAAELDKVAGGEGAGVGDRYFMNPPPIIGRMQGPAGTSPGGHPVTYGPPGVL